MRRNPHLAKLKTNYLFPEIAARKKKFLEKNPETRLINLGVGDTTHPLPKAIGEALAAKAHALSTHEGYSGYGLEEGNELLRKKIASKIYNNRFSTDEIFISDGANCDIARLQSLFGGDIPIALQDPSYPVYLDGSMIQGIQNVTLLPCTIENNFFPNLTAICEESLIYFCSPNNPTGIAHSRQELEKLVQFALKKGCVIIFDAAYTAFIQDKNIPKTIFEIEGAEKCAVEVGSFSKLAGFTGVRLGWSAMSKSLRYHDGRSILEDWKRIVTTLFNGASNIAQAGGEALLEKQNLPAIDQIIHYYLENARLLKEAFTTLGYPVYGGVNAPYLWVHFKGRTSWDVFEEFLEKYHLVTIPGSGFGASGEGFVRLSSFASRQNIQEAINRIIIHCI